MRRQPGVTRTILSGGLIIKIVLTGGGSGGHITPLLAVATELKRLQPSVKLIYIGQKGDKLGDIPSTHAAIDEAYQVRAGKFRRYHGEGWKQLLDLPTLLLNIRDAFYTLSGLIESRRLLKKLRPSGVFIKGGFVGVPVGLAAAQLHLPYVTHDSDAIPGLANRIIARWASAHAVALPAELYQYPADKTVTTGIPLQAEFHPVSEKLRQQYRSEIEVPKSVKMLFIIGGGLGAQRINHAVVDAVPNLLREFPDLYVVHGAGRANEAEIKAGYEQHLSESEQGRIKVFGYISDIYRYSGAADLIITRAGATNLAEFALQGRACIIIPSPFLTGGHQLKNAEYIAQKSAGAVLQERDFLADPNRLAKQVSDLLRDDAKRHLYEQNVSQFAKPNATKELALLILSTIDGSAV
jgi:UDP-N-acetylglucosamine--N-acetylmuramyl-(pentapeptide) pyrophosphoryl-undecaprenol N-acetylglucosamine transferase